jgi:hypothetical protein
MRKKEGKIAPPFFYPYIIINVLFIVFSCINELVNSV